MSRHRINALLILLCLISNSNCANNEYFSSVSGLEVLLNTEIVILDELERYVNTLSAHLEALQTEIASIKVEHVAASTDLEGYLNNPVNAFRLIKRLHNDWTIYEESVRNEISQMSFLDAMATHRQNLGFPSVEDAFGSAEALIRLEETYKLDVEQIASGILNGIKYGTSMSWQDCFTLGQHLFDMRDFNHTIPWLKQSTKMLIEQDYNSDPLSLDFIEFVASYHQEMGDFETALQLINHLHSIDVERDNLNATKIYLEQMIRDGVKEGLLHEAVVVPRDYRQSNEFKLYEKVCRTEITTSASEQRHLHCKYHSNNVAYRLLQPFKMEVLFMDPFIVQYHDVIRDDEITVMKRLARPRITRSMVRTVDGSAGTASNYRISKTAFFTYDKHPYMEKMLRHVRDLSGLNVEQAENLQVVNYGIGGHYEPHFDFFTDEYSYDDIDGNRVATNIFYLSDVEEGGGTAFPFLRVLVKPEKGSVLFWYNLHASEDPDYRTKHAACPVLKGSKWIANIWLRIRGQEHERPCGLKREHESSIIYKDYD